ncbi:hypothetical protein DUZ99_01535 [Xylanibacillus composti]|uniref:Type II secretion system protein GspF domain-containing protein n=1 Tax=Xylanibacillus composti TaxID=1572762 RepID=A0A8J4H8I1_9BACL|nr:type II secretion system F family protein [Xylanibacillus composti]MDT9723680.1 hypothetical protein [Xylanibacillus composti]GIQ71019.1 hypothetical protein XYCOK13_38430 [Xylanibacillus composti]
MIRSLVLVGGILFLFLACFFAIRLLAGWYWGRLVLRRRLEKRKGPAGRFAAVRRESKLLRDYELQLQAMGAVFTVRALAAACAMLALIGIVIGGVLFYSLQGMLVTAVLLSCSPLLYYQSKLIAFRMRTRLAFLPAVEVIYQYYVLSPSGNMRAVLAEAAAEQHLPPELAAAFEMLERRLSLGSDPDEALQAFQSVLGHLWARSFAGIVRISLLEGVPVEEGLKELIGDMRRAQQADRRERNRLLEIRVANFAPVFFLAVFLFINFKVDAEKAYLYYLLDPEGRSMLLDACALIFLSFLGGLYLSMKRM